MRQNTKVIIASSQNDEESAPPNPEQRETKPASSSSRKASQPTWTTEPWQGHRRQSIKLAGAPGKKKPASGSVPPLPGQASNVQEAALAVEELENNGLNETLEEGEERGRLFVKVVGIKDLDLPLPRGEYDSDMLKPPFANVPQASDRISRLLWTMACTALPQHGSS